MANAHLCSALPNFLLLEFHSEEVTWWEDLVKRPKPLIEKGYLKVYDAPGLGLELDREEVQKHLKKGKIFYQESNGSVTLRVS